MKMKKNMPDKKTVSTVGTLWQTHLHRNKPVEFFVHLRNIKINNICLKNMFFTLLNK